jgi:hypothetical protein
MTIAKEIAISKILRIQMIIALKNLLHDPVDKFSQIITEGSGADLTSGHVPSMYLLLYFEVLEQHPPLKAFIIFFLPFML